MGLIGRRRPAGAAPKAPGPSKLAGMPTEDILILAETSVMEAQRLLVAYRQSPPMDKPWLVSQVATHVKTADLVVQELERR